MNGIQLLSSIIKGDWAIDLEAAQSYLPLLANIFNYKAEFEKVNDKDAVFAMAASPEAATQARYSRYDSYDKAEPNSIAVISIKGALMKYDQSCGPRGMQSMGKMIQEADAHHNIGSIVLMFDTPGGSVDGLERLASIISGTAKPTIGFINGMSASAGVRLHTECDEIYASDEMDRVGSIGVMMNYLDVIPALEKLGVKRHVILSSYSADKNKDFEEILQGKYEDYRKNILDPLAERFINSVKTNCPDVKEERLTGKMFFAKNVVGELITGIMAFEEVLDRAQELANTNSTNNQSHTSMKQFKHVNAALGVDNLESADDTVALNEQQLEALDNALGTQATQKAELETANQAKADAEAEVATLKAEVAELKGKPAALRSTTIVENDDTAEAAQDDTLGTIESAKELFNAIEGID